jgi:hypothetical protein
VAASLSIDFSIALLSPSSVDAESWLSLLSMPSRERKTGEYKAVAMYLESRSSQDCASSAALYVRSLTRVKNLRRCRTLSAGQMWKYPPRFSLSTTGTDNPVYELYRKFLQCDEKWNRRLLIFHNMFEALLYT